MQLQKNKILWAITVLGLIVVGFYIYNYTPQISAYRYVFAYNNNNFEKAFSYYNKEAMLDKFSKKEIIDVLQEQAKTSGKITSKQLTMVKDKTTKKWFVKFPYSLQSIYVSAPVGASVYINDKTAAHKVVDRGVELKDILPGKHSVTIEYYDHMHPAYTKTINVPEEIRVDSPYPTCDISVVAPIGTWVKIGDIIRHNTDANQVFKNMLPGQYDISVLTEDKEIEMFSKTTQIDYDNSNIHIDKIKGSEHIKSDVVEFFQRFNSEYKQGIIAHDATFLYKFLTQEINEDVISDFKMWYIDNKDVKDAKSLMEVRDVYPLSGNEVKTPVLETVYLTNLQKDVNGKEVEEEYRVVIEWNYKLLRKDSTWQIVKREMLQSIVAYKNDEGNWIKY